MKKLVITCMMLSVVSITFAQNKASKSKAATASDMQSNNEPLVEPHDLTAAQVKSAQQKAEKRSKDLRTKLGLTADQYQKVLEAETRFQKNYDMYPAGKVPSGFLSNITSERDSYIKAALSADQYATYTAMNKTK